MRNTKTDDTEAADRREKLLEIGFQMFAERSIEGVKLQEIADASGVGIATLYRYFENKPNMVIEIGTRKWQEYYIEVEEEFAKLGMENSTAAEELEFFLDCFIRLYIHHKDILRFNKNFDSYVIHEGCTEEQMRPYNEAVTVFAEKFHRLFSKVKEDDTLAVRVSEKKMFVNTMYIMLSVAGKYAEGLVYPRDADKDMTEELYMLKAMILNAYSNM